MDLELQQIVDARPIPEADCVRIEETPVGKGVFAAQPFPQGVVVGEITGRIIADEHYSSDYSFDIGDGFQMEPGAPFRFLNHSCEPNCEFDYLEVECDQTGGLRKQLLVYTIAEIMPGEELTIDYNWPPEHAIPCMCNAENCRGWVVSEDSLDEMGEDGFEFDADDYEDEEYLEE